MILAFSLIILFISIILHEVAHGYAASALGDPTARLAGRLTLNPIPHIDPIGSILVPGILVLTGSPIFFGWAKPVPYNPYNLTNQRWGELLVAGAGPATNLFLAIIFGTLVRFAPTLGLSGPALTIASLIVLINLLLGVFNLIPFPPLDGYTVLRGLFPWRFSVSFQRVEMQIRSMGIMLPFLVIIVFWYVLAGPFSQFIYWLFGLLTGGGTL